MPVANNRRAQPSAMPGEAVVLWIGIVLVVVTVGTITAAMHLGHRLLGTGQQLPGNPMQLVFGLIGGDVPWPGLAGWIIAALVLMLFLGLGLTVVIFRLRSGSKATRVDRAAAYMGRGKDIASITEKGATATAQRLGVQGAAGVPIGRAVGGGQQLMGSWEDTHVDIWGPRTGKTTSRVIPAILEAPGPVVVTSNKRDVVDATRDVRAAAGDVWVFDPQGVALEPATWWWNPLSYVTDEVHAQDLADHFASASRRADSRGDAYFDSAGRDLLAGLFLAAALDHRPITDVYRWLTRPTSETAIEILAAHGYGLISDQVAGVVGAPEKQRGGIFGTAQQMAACLTNRRVTDWITPPAQPRPEFQPEQFVTGPGTLYSLSMEGAGNAAPIITALTVAVTKAAEQRGIEAGGRLNPPMLAALDEAANVCRWAELPNLYSHYSSRGIILMTVLQSYSQGVAVWGEEGMKKLWNAANVKVYGGGVVDTDFLSSLSTIVGEYDKVTRSSSRGRGHSSVNEQLQRERILAVDELAALPKGRAVVVSSGNRATLVNTQPWMSGPHAEAVTTSITRHDPASRHTLSEAERELQRVQAQLEDQP